MIAKVTAPDLAQDVPGAEALISRHSEHKAEIDTRSDAFDKFYTTGKKLIDQVTLILIVFFFCVCSSSVLGNLHTSVDLTGSLLV